MLITGKNTSFQATLVEQFQYSPDPILRAEADRQIWKNIEDCNRRVFTHEIESYMGYVGSRWSRLVDLQTALINDDEIEHTEINRNELIVVANWSGDFLNVDKNLVFGEEFAPPIAAELGRRAAVLKTDAARIEQTHTTMADFADTFPDSRLYRGMNLAWMQKSQRTIMNDRAGYDLGQAYAIAECFEFSLSDACRDSSLRAGYTLR